MGGVPIVDRHRAVRQVIEVRLPKNTIRPPVESAPGSQSFACEPSIELRGIGSRPPALGDRRCGSVFPEGIAAAQTARTVASCERNGVVQEEERRPGPWRIERLGPIPIAQHADDPRTTNVMPHERRVGIDETASVAGEETSAGVDVEVPEGIDAVRETARLVLAHASEATPRSRSRLIDFAPDASRDKAMIHAIRPAIPAESTGLYNKPDATP